MLYIFHGEDEYYLLEELKQLKHSIGDPSMLAINTTEIDAQDLNPEQLKAVCDTTPFLAAKRLVIIYDLLTRFEPKSRSAQTRKENPAAKQEELKKIADCLSATPDSTLLVLVDVAKLHATNPLLKAVTPKANVKIFTLKRGDELRKWIQERVSTEGGRIAPQAVNMLTALVGGNLIIMGNEIKKLVAYCAGRIIEESDVKNVVSSAQEFDIFAMVDAIIDGRAGMAEQILQSMLRKGVNASYLLLMLSRQIRMMILYKEMKSRNKSTLEMQTKLGITWQIKQLSEQAGKYTMDHLKHVYRKLLETDLAIKTGKFDEDLALNMLIAELSQAGRL